MTALEENMIISGRNAINYLREENPYCIFACLE